MAQPPASAGGLAPPGCDVASPRGDAQARDPFTPARLTNTGQRGNLHLVSPFIRTRSGGGAARGRLFQSTCLHIIRVANIIIDKALSTRAHFPKSVLFSKRAAEMLSLWHRTWCSLACGGSSERPKTRSGAGKGSDPGDGSQTASSCGSRQEGWPG